MKHYLNNSLESRLREQALILAEHLSKATPIEDDQGSNPDSFDPYIYEMLVEVEEGDPSETIIFIETRTSWGSFCVELGIDPERLTIINAYLIVLLFADAFSFNLDTDILMNSFGVRISPELFVSMGPLVHFAKMVKLIIEKELNTHGESSIIKGGV